VLVERETNLGADRAIGVLGAPLELHARSSRDLRRDDRHIRFSHAQSVRDHFAATVTDNRERRKIRRVSSKLALNGRVVVIANPTEPALPPGRVFKVRPIDSTQEPKPAVHARK
jgi:hypothetical protein